MRVMTGSTVDEDMNEQVLERLTEEMAEEYDEQDAESWTHEMEIKGKQEEFRRLQSFGAFSVISKNERKAEGTFLTVKWVLKAKVDDMGRKTCRARLCGRDYKHLDPYNLSFFAPTTGGSTQRLVDLTAVKNRWPTLTADVSSAFLHTPVEGLWYSQPPEEWIAESPQDRKDQIWVWHRVLNGMREGPRLWLLHFGKWFEKQGYERHLSNANYMAKRNIFVEIHMDDVHATGEEYMLRELMEQMSKEFIVKWQLHAVREASYEHLRRQRLRTPHGMLITMGAHHVEHLAKLFGYDVNVKGKMTPLPVTTNIALEGEELSKEEWSIYRRGVGILLYAAADRPDCQYAVQLLSQRLASPTSAAMKALRHLARYVVTTRDRGIFFPVQGDVCELEAISDSNWANDPTTRRSTSCGVLRAGGCTLYVFVRRQAVVSLSSAEAEYYASTTTVSEAIAVVRLLALAGFKDEHGHELKIRAKLDSSSARSLMSRQGVGRVRHLAARTLWLQQLVAEKRVTVSAVPGEHNMADIGTKLLSADRLAYLRKLLGMRSPGEDVEASESAVQRLCADATTTQTGASMGAEHAAKMLVISLGALLAPRE